MNDAPVYTKPLLFSGVVLHSCEGFAIRKDEKTHGSLRRSSFLSDTNLGNPITNFLETDRWSADSVDTFFRNLIIGKFVHSFYYRDSTCIRRIARWLNAPEPNPDPLEAEILNELIQVQTLGRVRTQDDPWS